MSETKRYYWFKMKTDFFDEMIIKFLRTQKKGDSMIIIFQRIMLFSLRNDGYIYYKNMLPTFEDELSLAIGEKADIIRKTLELLIKFGAIEKIDDSTYYIKMLEECIGSETRDAARMRKKKQNGENFSPVNENFSPEIEKETEKEIYSDKEKKTSSFSREKKGGSFTRKNNYYKNNSKPKKSTSYDIDEFLRENEAKAAELVYVSSKEDGEP